MLELRRQAKSKRKRAYKADSATGSQHELEAQFADDTLDEVSWVTMSRGFGSDSWETASFIYLYR
jgi:hypothetical protein